MDDFRKHIATENLEIQKRHLQLAEEKKPKTSKRNPLPRNWKEVGERVRIAHGISKEEWARRQALHDKYDENGNPKTTEPEPSSLTGGERTAKRFILPVVLASSAGPKLLPSHSKPPHVAQTFNTLSLPSFPLPFPLRSTSKALLL